MVRHVKRVAIQIAGWLFVVLGIAGLVLPVLQGILFLMIGFYLLSLEYEWAHRLLEKLRQRYPDVFRRARYWQALLGLTRSLQPGDPAPLSLPRRVLVWGSLAALLISISILSRAGLRFTLDYWGDLQQRYKVVEVRQQDNAQIVELRRTWALKDRNYLLRCHLCQPVEVGNSYHFEPVPGQKPPMMKLIGGPGTVPDFYTVVEGKVPEPESRNSTTETEP